MADSCAGDRLEHCIPTARSNQPHGQPQIFTGYFLISLERNEVRSSTPEKSLRPAAGVRTPCPGGASTSAPWREVGEGAFVFTQPGFAGSYRTLSFYDLLKFGDGSLVSLGYSLRRGRARGNPPIPSCSQHLPPPTPYRGILGAYFPSFRDTAVHLHSTI